jgi:hypothetical protein
VIKKALSLFIFVFQLQGYAQYSWQRVVDLYNYYPATAPVLSLYTDTNSTPPQLLLGSGPNELTNTISGSTNFYHTLYFYNLGSFAMADCAPNSPVDTARILCFSGAKDTIYNQNYLAVGGVFNSEGCSPGPPDDLRNLIFYESGGGPSYLFVGDMSASDTVFAVGTIADYDNQCITSIELYFRTYVGARCAYCSQFDSGSIDSSRYIAFYDPAKNCVSNGTYDYMEHGTNGPVYAIQAIDTSNVYAGGVFDSAGVIAAKNIAKWNGVSWDSLGSGINGTVKVLLWRAGNLYAGGNFTMAGGSTANNIAMWNGTTWLALGTGTNGTVNTLTFHNGELYAGGNFTQAGNSTVNYIAKWNGTTWSDLSGGRNGEVYTLASFHNDLFVGGNFTGGTNDTVKYFVAYHDSTVNVVEQQDAKWQVTAFPNPVDDKVSFGVDQHETVYLTILNVLGEIVCYRSFESQSLFEVNTTEFNSGLYFYRIEDDNQNCSSGKFVVEH